jgi:hypothetical protein
MSPILQSRANASAIGYGAFSVAAAASDFESIATVTVGSGGSSTITFSSIPGTYTHLQIRETALTTENGPNTLIRFNSDTGNNYANHQLYGTGSSALASGNTSIDYIFGSVFSNSSTSPSVAVVDILDYANTNKYKTVRLLSGCDTNGGGLIILRSGVWMNTNAITSIQLPISAGNYSQYSHFALYGIKGA